MLSGHEHIYNNSKFLINSPEMFSILFLDFSFYIHISRAADLFRILVPYPTEQYKFRFVCTELLFLFESSTSILCSHVIGVYIRAVIANRLGNYIMPHKSKQCLIDMLGLLLNMQMLSYILRITELIVVTTQRFDAIVVSLVHQVFSKYILFLDCERL